MLLLGLASDGVYMCPACYQSGGSLLHCLSTLTSALRCWRFISVALALESPPPDVIRHPALWSPDFPHLIKSAAIVCLTCRMFYCSVILNDCLWGIVILSTLQSPSGRCNGKFRNLTMPVLKCQLLCAVPEIGQIDHNYFLIPNSRLFFRKIFQISNAVIPYWADRKYLPFSTKICFILWAFSISIFPSAQISFFILHRSWFFSIFTDIWL